MVTTGKSIEMKHTSGILDNQKLNSRNKSSFKYHSLSVLVLFTPTQQDIMEAYMSSLRSGNVDSIFKELRVIHC